MEIVYKIPKKRVSFCCLGVRGFQDTKQEQGVIMLFKDSNTVLKPYVVVLDKHQATDLLEGLASALEWKPK